MTQDQKVVDRMLRSVEEEFSGERANLQGLSLTKQSSTGSALDHSMLQNLNVEDQLA